MARHHSELVDPAAGTAIDRLGRRVPLTAVAVGNGTLYYSRVTPPNLTIGAIERWVLPEQGWVLNRFDWLPEARRWMDWYIDIDATTVEDGRWRIDDRLLDVAVVHRSRYLVLDADELADALSERSIALSDAAAALRAQQTLCHLLEELEYDVPALLARFAPELPLPAVLPAC